MSISNKPASSMKEDDYRAEDDLRTLMAAAKIRADKGRMRAAMAKRDEQKGHLSSIRMPRNG